MTFTNHPKPDPGTKVLYSMTYGDEPHDAAASTSGDGGITYMSSDEAIAIVDENGSVNAVSAGNVTITATAAETDTYSESSESFNLTVYPKEVSITGITAKERQYDPEDFYVDLDFTNASINGMVTDDDLNIDITNATGRTNQFNKVTGPKEVYVEGVALAGLKKDAYKLKMNTIDGIYLGIDLTVNILPKQMDSSMITDIPAQIHTGLPITPELTVTHGNTILNMGENEDYTVEYTNNTNIGTATATITGHGKYTGTAFKDFNIDKQKPAATVTPVNSTLTYGDTLTINVTDLTAVRNSLAENKVGLYLADGTELATADVTNGSAALTYDTKGKKLPIGESTLTVKYGGSDTLSTNDSLGTVTVTLEQKALAASVPYDGNADFNNIPLTLLGVENPDTVTATCSGSTDSPYAGTYPLTNLTVTLYGADKSWYTAPTSASGNVTITAADQTLTSSYTDEKNAYALSSDGEEIDLTTLVAGMASGNTPAFTITDGDECAILNSTVLTSTAISGTVIITVSANAYDLNSDGTNEYSASDNLLIYIKVNNTHTTPTAVPGVALDNKVAYAGVEWWVIGLNDKGINPQNGTMTLLSKDNLFQTRFDTNENRGGTANNNYNGSLLQKEMINYYNNLNPGEQAMILPRNVLDGMSYNSSTKEHSGTLIGTHYIWPLSREEAGKLDGNIRRSSPPGDGTYWLTRSAFSDSTTHAIIVNHWGTMNDKHPVTYLGNGKFGRPALTVNLSDVLFTSNAADDKPAVKTGLHAVTPLSGTVKLTVKNDSLLSLDLDSTEPITAKSGRTVSLNYTNARTGIGHSVSILICDPDSNIRYYGRLGNCENSSDGTITFTVPGNLPNGDYKLLVFNEQVNGKNMTDFASTPVEIDLKVVEPEVVDVPGAALHKSVRFAGEDWWVIGLNGNGVNSKSGTATLLSKDNIIADTKFSGNDAYSPSKLRAAMENFYRNLSTDEQALILPRELDNVQGTGSVSNPSITLSGDHYVWPLSKAEAVTLPQDTILANGSSWWLRSTSTPAAGYYIDTVTAEGLFDSEYSYNILGGRPALTLDLSKLNTITATAGANGKISPSGTMHVFPDSNQTFTITAENGYEIDDVLVNNTSVKNQLSGNTYTFTNITENKTIAASFRKISFPHTHTYSSEWKSDDTRHWRECACGAKEEEAFHDYTPWTIDEKTEGDKPGTSSRKCKVCSYKHTETNTCQTLTDPETGIKASGCFTSDAALSVKETLLHGEGTCPVCDEIRARQTAGELIALYDLTLSSGICNGEAEISFPVDKKYNGQMLLLLHCMDRQEERLEAEAKGGFVTGTFKGLSPFAILKTATTQSVKLTPSSLTLELGKSRQLQATVFPADAYNKKITWKTSDKNVATVSASGLVKAFKTGTATITCSAADGGGAKATCRVTVQNTATPILIMKGTAGKNSVRLNWNQISNADGYDIYGSRCGNKYSYKKIKTITKGTTTTWTQRNLRPTTAYKYYAKAYKLVNGKKLYLRVSKTCHIVTTGGRYTNVKSITTTFTDITLAKGKTRQISARVTSVKKGAKLANHVPEFRYKTTNGKVATVTAAGKIKAVEKGKCSVYVYANNGVYKRIRITVQ